MKPILLALLACLTLEAQASRLDERAVRAHLAFLADDVLEGRGTGQRGGELAVRYLETQLQALGLAPANGDSYRQKVALAGLRLDPAASSLRFEGPRGVLTPALGEELALGAAAPEAQLAVDAPLVFVGHGIADGHRDDYKGLDVRGRILVMLVGDRKNGPPLPLCCEAENYEGRWTYKFEEARRRGAAGALLIHTDASAGYGWPVVRNSWSQERFQRAGSGQPGAVQGGLGAGALRGAAAPLDGCRCRRRRRGLHRRGLVPDGIGRRHDGGRFRRSALHGGLGQRCAAGGARAPAVLRPGARLRVPGVRPFEAAVYEARAGEGR